MRAKQLLLFFGLTITLACLFLPILTSCEYFEDDYRSTYLRGYESPIYYISLFFLLFVIAFSPTARHKRSPIVASTCAVIGGVFTLSQIWFGGAFSDLPCGSLPTLFMYLLLFGHVLIVVSAMSAIFARKQMPVFNLTNLIEEVFHDYFLDHGFIKVHGELGKRKYQNPHLALSFWVDYSELIVCIELIENDEVLEIHVREIWMAYNDPVKFRYSIQPQWKTSLQGDLDTIKNYIPKAVNGDFTWVADVKNYRDS